MVDSFLRNYSINNTQGYSTPISKGTQAGNCYHRTPSFASQPNTVELSNNKKQELSDGAKWGIGLGLTALASVGIYFATRGKGKIKLNANQEAKIKELITNGKLDDKHAEIFKSIEHLEGDEFIKEAYKRIAKSMGYGKLSCPPLEICSRNNSSSTSLRRIRIDKLGFSTKEKQIGAIRHELEHFRQDEIMYRALGKESYLNAMVEKSINKLKYNEQFCVEQLGKKYSELTEQELQTYRNKLKTAFNTSENFDILELLLAEKGKIVKGSAEYTEAEKFYAATLDYITPNAAVNETLTSELIKKLKAENSPIYNAIQKANKIYQNSYLETEARTVEAKIKEMYQHFCDALK